MFINAVFEGGGVRGIAFLGAIEEMEKAGYKWANVAGTSAGSIIAALLSAGFASHELAELFLSFPFEAIKKKTGISKIPVIGTWIGLFLNNGIYTSQIIETWLDVQLRKKGKHTFADLGDKKLKIVVTDLTKNRMTVIPDDLPQYGIDPGIFPISRAVRMSCSIPFILRPLKLSGDIIVDGAVLSNFPIWIFDAPEKPTIPTIGFRLSGQSFIPQPQSIQGPIDIAEAIVRTLMDGHDNRYIDSHSAVHTIFIKGINVETTAFELPMEEKLRLVQLGKEATLDFLRKSDFRNYIDQYRTKDRVVNIGKGRNRQLF